MMGNKSIFEKKSVMIVTALFCCLLWGSAFPGIKFSYAALGIHNEFGKILLAGFRFSLAGIFVLIFAGAKQKINILPTKKEMPFFLLIALLQTFGAYFLFYIGLSYTTGVKASILTSVSVFFVAILAHFMTGSDKLSLKKGVGLLCGFSGVVLVNLSILATSEVHFSLMGEGFMLISSAFGAVTTVLIRKYAGKFNVVKLNGWQLFIGGIMLIIVGFVGYPKMLSFNGASGGLLVYLAAVSATGFTLWFTLLKHHNASLIGQYKFVVPISGSLLSVMFIPGEYIEMEMLFAVALVAVGIFIVNRQERKPAQDLL